MQRIQDSQQGLYKSVFEPKLGSSSPIIHIDGETTVDSTFYLESDEHTAQFGLRGRATTAFPVKSKMLLRLSLRHSHHNSSEEPATELYWPEDSLQIKHDINAVHEIAQRKLQVDGRVPEIIWLHQVEGTSMAKIRKGLGIGHPERGSRLLNIDVFWKLQPITKLSGEEFMHAWWLVVISHRILWISGVRHHDVSPSNLMVYQTPSGLVMGVINDYDLSSIQDSPGGHERRGTVPFMAIELLTKGFIEGNAKHLYQHVAESLIWVLTWVCLRYEDGELLSRDRPLDSWLRGDAIRCQKNKCSFLMLGRKDYEVQVSPSHQSNWKIARSCLSAIALSYVEDPKPVLEGELVYRTWFKAQQPSRSHSENNVHSST
ncbi:hypothetical protein DFH29DRAFT_849558 [Suillus ampliporus]|nr:hypothetical protein DFH29DRAFT_849558 [Suillus ampliporus]